MRVLKARFFIVYLLQNSKSLRNAIYQNFKSSTIPLYIDFLLCDLLQQINTAKRITKNAKTETPTTSKSGTFLLVDSSGNGGSKSVNQVERQINFTDTLVRIGIRRK
jgi:hypothetical protein